MAPYILPYLRNRPVVLHRFPDGIHGQSFYQKECGPNPPAFIKTVPVQHEERKVHYFVINNKESLLYIANLGSIELHPFHARLPSIDKPDYCIFDLDPTGVSFDAVIDVALTIHKLLDEFKLPHVCKTSGGSGLHIYIPLHGKYDYKTVKQFATLFARYVHEQLPGKTSLERNPQKRKRKIYLDILQNQKMQTVICPYAVRGFPHAPVSTPLEWKELKHGLRPTDFTIRTVPKRVAKKKDLFKPVLHKTTNLQKVIKTLEKKI
jgi:bifunctional non-homologous end joining protein LigD